MEPEFVEKESRPGEIAPEMATPSPAATPTHTNEGRRIARPACYRGTFVLSVSVYAGLIPILVLGSSRNCSGNC